MTNEQAQIEAELTISEAAEATGVSRSTIRRRRENGSFERARLRPSDNAWVIPVSDLIKAGYTLSSPGARSESEHEQGNEQGFTVPLSHWIEIQKRLATLEAENRGQAQLIESQSKLIGVLEGPETVESGPTIDLTSPGVRQKRSWFRRKKTVIPEISA